jgi:hypothetical protein
MLEQNPSGRGSACRTAAGEWARGRAGGRAPGPARGRATVRLSGVASAACMAAHLPYVTSPRRADGPCKRSDVMTPGRAGILPARSRHRRRNLHLPPPRHAATLSIQYLMTCRTSAYTRHNAPPRAARATSSTRQSASLLHLTCSPLHLTKSQSSQRVRSRPGAARGAAAAPRAGNQVGRARCLPPPHREQHGSKKPYN